MTPGEIRACYRLYAAHRRSHEICTFPETIPVMNNAGDPDDLAVLLRLHMKGWRVRLSGAIPMITYAHRPLGTSVTCERCSRRSLPSRSVATLWWGAEVIGVAAALT